MDLYMRAPKQIFIQEGHKNITPLFHHWKRIILFASF